MSTFFDYEKVSIKKASSKRCFRHTPMTKSMLHSLAQVPSGNGASTFMPGLLRPAQHLHARLVMAQPARPVLHSLD